MRRATTGFLATDTTTASSRGSYAGLPISTFSIPTPSTPHSILSPGDSAAHIIGDPGYSPAYHPFGNGSATQINVTNAISVQGGSNSPADLRRTAEQLAQFTTGEVRKQMARSS